MYSLPFTSLSPKRSRPLLNSLRQAFRLSVRRASTAPPGPKPTAPGRKYGTYPYPIHHYDQSLTTWPAYPENLVIYHAGTGRTTFIACLKLTTIFVFVFFGLVVTPAYLKSDHPLWHAGGGIFVPYSLSLFPHEPQFRPHPQPSPLN